MTSPLEFTTRPLGSFSGTLHTYRTVVLVLLGNGVLRNVDDVNLALLHISACVLLQSLKVERKIP